MVFDLDMITALYGQIPKKVEAARKLLNRPLTLTEKILYAHLARQPTKPAAASTAR